MRKLGIVITAFAAFTFTGCEKPINAQTAPSDTEPAAQQAPTPNKAEPDKTTVFKDAKQSGAPSVSGAERVIKHLFPDGTKLGTDLAAISKSNPRMVRHPDDKAGNRVTRFVDPEVDGPDWNTHVEYLVIDGNLRGIIWCSMIGLGEAEKAKYATPVHKQAELTREVIAKHLMSVETTNIRDTYANKTESVQLFNDEATGISVYLHDGSARLEVIIFDPKYLIKSDFFRAPPTNK